MDNNWSYLDCFCSTSIDFTPTLVGPNSTDTVRFQVHPIFDLAVITFCSYFIGFFVKLLLIFGTAEEENILIRLFDLSVLNFCTKHHLIWIYLKILSKPTPLQRNCFQIKRSLTSISNVCIKIFQSSWKLIDVQPSKIFEYCQRSTWKSCGRTYSEKSVWGIQWKESTWTRGFNDVTISVSFDIGRETVLKSTSGNTCWSRFQN